MIVEGLIITGIGLGVVFSFLVLLIFCMKGMSAVIIRFFPDKIIEEPVRGGQSLNNEIAVAIAAAKAFSKK
ncbi:MAG: OadG family protein [Spirochaetales bacterium]|nr:OadG family protein [Spirochaetales bacterium]